VSSDVSARDGLVYFIVIANRISGVEWHCI